MRNQLGGNPENARSALKPDMLQTFTIGGTGYSANFIPASSELTVALTRRPSERRGGLIQ
ncbi:hypothetical protein CGLAMM_07150 [Acetobacteraceae bacterium EV16G]|uniref:Uncharacterized protein n=1 Tax=Sorlinia euscelidii TaxID=3081148 RepID=A0ABU7U456_9PROT